MLLIREAHQLQAATNGCPRIDPIRLLAIRLGSEGQVLALVNALPMRLEDEQQVAG